MNKHAQIKQEMKETLAHLRSLRDEIRVRLHLAGMDAKETWRKLDAQLDRADRWVDQATEEARTAMHKLAGGVRAFRDSLKDEPKTPAAHG
jgi:hypothetical protein